MNKAVVTIHGCMLATLLALTGLAAKVALDDAPVEVAQPLEASVLPQRYDYHVDSIPDLEWATKAQKLGQDGWELVFARRASDGDGNFLYECIFKRPSRIPEL